jgi:hypothetical protein
MPATANFILDKGFDAAAAITKFRAVKLTTTAEQVTPVTAVSDQVIGVEQFGVTAAEILKGKGASVRVAGISEMEASAAITIGDRVGIAADGRAKTAVVGDRVVGVCFNKGATAAGERISVLLDLPGMLMTTGS